VSPDELQWLAELALSDSPDIKANIWLFLITFLAALDGGLKLAPRAGAAFHWLQFFALALVTGSGVRTVLALCPRKYAFAHLPGLTADWLREADEYFASPAAALAYVQGESAERAIRRAAGNHKIKGQKLALFLWAYWLWVPAAAVVIASLAWIALRMLA
jgi:hypothetical protein